MAWRVAEDLVDPQGMLTWLERYPDTWEHRVQNPHMCPIARYLVEGAGHEGYIAVLNRSLQLGWDSKRLLPLWSREFIKRVDREGFLRGDTRYITTGTAKTILKEVLVDHE